MKPIKAEFTSKIHIDFTRERAKRIGVIGRAHTEAYSISAWEVVVCLEIFQELGRITWWLTMTKGACKNPQSAALGGSDRDWRRVSGGPPTRRGSTDLWGAAGALDKLLLFTNLVATHP